MQSGHDITWFIEAACVADAIANISPAARSLNDGRARRVSSTQEVTERRRQLLVAETISEFQGPLRQNALPLGQNLRALPK